MKRKLITTTALLVGLFAVTLPARADRLGFQIGVAGGNGYFRVGFGSGRDHHHNAKATHRHDRRSKYDRHKHRGRNHDSKRYRAPIRQVVRHGPRPVVHTCVKTPVYSSVWVEPVYRQAFDGRDARGRPRYVSVVVKPGYYRTYVSYYQCRCGKTFH